MEIIRSWTYIDPKRYNSEQTLTLYPNFIQIGDDKISYEEMLLSSENYLPFIIQKEVLLAISALDLGIEDLNREAHLTWLFYRHLDKSLLVPDSCKVDTFRTLHFNEDGFQLKHESKILSQQQLHSFLLYGPAENLSFEKRKSWTDQLLKALGNSSPIAVQDCFSLFDYDKIKEQEFVFHESEDFVYYFKINKGSAFYEGEEFMDGFSHKISIEHLWYFDRIPDKFEKHIPEIYENLRNAIVEKRRDNWYDLISNI